MTTGADWLDQARRLVETFLTPPAPEPAEGATSSDGTGHADTCRWCPVCQAAAVVRGERPEVSAALADVLTATASALRAFADEIPGATVPAEESDPEPAEESAGKPAEAPAEESDAGPAVQRIDIA